MPNPIKHSPADPHPIRTHKQKGNGTTIRFSDQGIRNYENIEWGQYCHSCGMVLCICGEDNER